MTKQTAALLLGLLNQQTLNVGAADFPEAVAAVLAARAELAAILAQPEPEPASS